MIGDPLNNERKLETNCERLLRRNLTAIFYSKRDTKSVLRSCTDELSTCHAILTQEHMYYDGKEKYCVESTENYFA